MKCPACFNQLTEIQVGNLKVDVCRGGCGGIWFDAFELQQVDEEAETGERARAAEARQTNLSAEFIRYLYRLQVK